MKKLESFIRPEHRSWDNGTYQEVVLDDVYQIMQRRFGPEDRVIDVGANIGLFSGAVLELGAGLVESVEPSPANFTALKRNLEPYGNRTLLRESAVWRSDMDCMILHLSEDTPDGNTGGINVIADVGEVAVQTISLDALIGVRPVTFLKVDCEGSEYPILYTAKKLTLVKELAIECHPVDHLLRPEANVRPGRNTPADLAGFLTMTGFAVRVDARAGMPEGWAYVRAVR